MCLYLFLYKRLEKSTATTTTTTNTNTSLQLLLLERVQDTDRDVFYGKSRFAGDANSELRNVRVPILLRASRGRKRRRLHARFPL